MLTDLIAEIVSRLMKADTEIREESVFREPERSTLAQGIVGGGLLLLLGACIYLRIKFEL